MRSSCCPRRSAYRGEAQALASSQLERDARAVQGCARHRSQVVLGNANAGLRDLGLAQPVATSVINGLGKPEQQWEFAMIDRIDHIVMNCRDVEATTSWYERGLGFGLNLRPTGSRGWATCKVDVPGSLDLCFITEGSLKPFIERWKSLGILITAGPAPRTGALGRMTSIYCEDPDGDLVEVATYSADP